jgi:hypothetical protein
MGKKGTVTRIPKDSVLAEYGISRSSSSALTRKAAAPMKFSNEIELHPTVVKMQRGMFATKESEAKKHDKRLEKTLQKLGKRDSLDSKLEELKISNAKYRSDHKMEHEVEIEKQRAEQRRRRKVSLTDVNTLADSQSARAMYDTSISNVSVKTDIKVKNEKVNVADSGIKMSDEIKKLRVSVTGSSVKEKPFKNTEYLSPSSQFFATQLGWIESEVPNRIASSPLQDYKTEESPENEIEPTKELTNNVSETDKVEDFVPEFREMDFAEIQRLERKYKKEADDIRRNLERQNRSQDRTIDNISTVYDKLLGNSPAVKVAKTKTKDLSDVSGISKDVDVSKIPSFVLEEQHRKETSKK